jgi:hypothetical protein
MRKEIVQAVMAMVSEESQNLQGIDRMVMEIGLIKETISMLRMKERDIDFFLKKSLIDAGRSDMLKVDYDNIRRSSK